MLTSISYLQEEGFSCKTLRHISVVPGQLVEPPGGTDDSTLRQRPQELHVNPKLARPAILLCNKTVC